jgi:Fusaric acid resistance protein family
MFGNSRWYFWYVAGFSVPLLALAGGADPLNDFQTVILRSEETALGVVSYSLVWLLIWPTSAREALEDAVRQLVAAHRELTARYLTQTIDEARDVSAEGLRRQTAHVLARLGGLLDGAEIDSYEAWETRRAWRGLIHQLSQLTSASERWRQSFAEVSELDRQRLIPELPKLAAELDHRFGEIERMLEGHPPARGSPRVRVSLGHEGIVSLSQFHRAALLVYRNHLQDIDRLTSDVFETAADIGNFTRTNSAPVREAVPRLPSALDPERLAAMARWFVGLWLAWLAALYVPGIPDTVEFIVLTNSISMALCVMPQLRIAAAYLPFAFGFVLGGAITRNHNRNYCTHSPLRVLILRHHSLRPEPGRARYLVIILLGAVLGVCSAGEITNVTQAFQPSGRLSWANSQ